MLREILARIEERLAAVGMSAAAASSAAGLTEDAIRNIRRAVEKGDRQGVSTATLVPLARVLGTTPAWLVGGTEEDRVRVIGLIGADAGGEILYADGQAGWDTVPRPPGGTSKTVALELKGRSMRTFADDGSLIYFEDQHTPPTPDMLGEVCVVETDDDRVLLKRLQRGSGPGLYDLESINGPTIRDAVIRWAAEPTAIIPPKQARRIIRRADERQVA